MNGPNTLFRLSNLCGKNIYRLYCSALPAKWIWRKPTGYDTGVTIYNSIVGNETPLILNNERLATWYTCGPTVYDEAHIGHASCYVKFDIMRRVLESFFNVDIVMVMGITDLDDKIINRAREMNLSIGHLTSQYEKEFYIDMASLRVQPPTIVTRVTDHIPQIINFCDSLLKKGFAYATPSGNLYFDTSKFPSYGKLQAASEEAEFQEELSSEKRSSRDFALWKGLKPGEPWWETPWGRGRPGWHIECSAMASHIFGPNLDIHSGGADLMFPHHENEETQCEAFHEQHQWANYWIHSGHLHMENNTKMSKSLKNTVSIKEFLKSNTVNEFRVFCLMTNYRDNVEYSDKSLSNATAMVKKFKAFLDDCDAYVDGHLTCASINDAEVLKCLNKTRVKIKEALKNDFNTMQSLNALEGLISKVHRNIQTKANSMPTAPRSAGVIAACSSYVSKILDLLGVSFPTKNALLASNDINLYALPEVMDSVLEFRRVVRHFALTTGPSASPEVHKMDSSSERTEKSSDLPDPLNAAVVVDKCSMEWTTKISKQAVKLQRKEREPLLIACDDLREKLLTVGIHIKDRGKDSDWSLLEDRSLEARKSSISSQDSFDPEYKPKQPA